MLSVRDAFLRALYEQVSAVKHRVSVVLFGCPCIHCLCFVMTVGFLTNRIVRVAPACFNRPDE